MLWKLKKNKKYVNENMIYIEPMENIILDRKQLNEVEIVVRHLRTDFCGPTFADGHLRIADRHLRTDFCGRTFADCGPTFADRTFADRF